MNKPKIIIKTSQDNKPFIVVKAGNGETLVTSETYNSKQGANNAVVRLQKLVPDAIVEDKTKKPTLPPKKPSKKG
jgi:uncharacterized protein YegP (UPF0339 family)